MDREKQAREGDELPDVASRRGWCESMRLETGTVGGSDPWWDGGARLGG